MRPFEFQPFNEGEEKFIEENNRFSDNAIEILEKASEIERLNLVKEFPDEILCTVFTRAFEKENYEINAFLKPIMEEKGMVIPK